jgi:hypothetical protein
MANFTYTPQEVIALEPEFPVIITQSDSFKKNYQLIETTATERYSLLFKAISTTVRNNILSHFNTTGYGGYASFSWTTVPSYIKTGTSQTVRYVPGSYLEEFADLSGLYNVSIVFEISV